MQSAELLVHPEARQRVRARSVLDRLRLRFRSVLPSRAHDVLAAREEMGAVQGCRMAGCLGAGAGEPGARGDDSTWREGLPADP